MWRVSHLYFCVITVIVFSSATEYVLAESSSFVRLFAISESDKLTFVDTHNKYRRAVDPTAANMMQMSWDYLLEERAKEVARECDFRHSVDLGRNISTNDFLQVGENLYSGGSYFVPEMPTEIVRLWYEEYQFYDLDSITCQANKVCGHYTQAVWADSYKVGCAIAECSAIITGTPPYLVACLYGIGGNVVLTNQLPNGTILRYPQPPYITGTPCSQCAEGYVCNDKLCEFSTATATATPVTTTSTTTTCSLNACGEEMAVFSCTPTEGGGQDCICNDGFEYTVDSKCSGFNLRTNTHLVFAIFGFFIVIFH